jgi:hypothetical protein
MSWPDDESTMQGGPEERDVSMPPEGAFMPDDVEHVGEVVVRQDGALGDHWHAVSPTVQPLLHSMPMRQTAQKMVIRHMKTTESVE